MHHVLLLIQAACTHILLSLQRLQKAASWDICNHGGGEGLIEKPEKVPCAKAKQAWPTV